MKDHFVKEILLFQWNNFTLCNSACFQYLKLSCYLTKK